MTIVTLTRGHYCNMRQKQISRFSEYLHLCSVSSSKYFAWQSKQHGELTVQIVLVTLKLVLSCKLCYFLERYQILYILLPTLLVDRYRILNCLPCCRVPTSYRRRRRGGYSGAWTETMTRGSPWRSSRGRPTSMWPQRPGFLELYLPW